MTHLPLRLQCSCHANVRFSRHSTTRGPPPFCGHAFRQNISGLKTAVWGRLQSAFLKIRNMDNIPEYAQCPLC